MEPVILFIGLGIIISITSIKLKKLQLERERLHIGHPTAPPDRDRKYKKGEVGPVTQEVQQLNRRIENIETIVIGGEWASLDQHTDIGDIRKQLVQLSKKVEELENEKKRVKNDI
jgi:hypothetical protein